MAITASGLLPADYCQLGTAVCPPADTNGIGLESDMWFGDKALVLRRDMAGVMHYYQLGKLTVVTDGTVVHAR